MTYPLELPDLGANALDQWHITAAPAAGKTPAAAKEVGDPAKLIVGTWRAAEREQAEKRRAGLSGVWCKVAKLMILLGAIGTGSRVVNDLPRLGAHVRTALGEQAASPFAVTPQRDGRAVLFTGGINDGAADALE